MQGYGLAGAVGFRAWGFAGILSVGKKEGNCSFLHVVVQAKVRLVLM